MNWPFARSSTVRAREEDTRLAADTAATFSAQLSTAQVRNEQLKTNLDAIKQELDNLKRLSASRDRIVSFNVDFAAATARLRRIVPSARIEYAKMPNGFTVEVDVSEPLEEPVRRRFALAVQSLFQWDWT